MSKFSELDQDLQSIREAMQEPVTEPLAQWLNGVFSKTDDLMVATARRSYRHLDKQTLLDALGLAADDVYTMSHIATRLQLIASNIEARDVPKLKMVQNNG